MLDVIFNTYVCKIWCDVRSNVFLSVSFGVFGHWLSRSIFAGGSSHRDWSETPYTGHVSFRQQAEEQVLLPLGSGHYLKEKDKSPSHYQPGLWGFPFAYRWLFLWYISFKAANRTTFTTQIFLFAFSSSIYLPKFCLKYDHLALWSSLQVFADGEEPVKKPIDGIYVDPAKEHRVRRDHSFSVCLSLTVGYWSSISANSIN